MVRQRPILILLLLILVSTSGYAQSDTASLFDTVRRSLLGPVSIREVTAAMQDSGILAGLRLLSPNVIANSMSGMFDDLNTGADGSAARTIASNSSEEIWQRNTLTVRAHFEQRPIGGILTIAVAILTAFNGVGDAPRPLLERHYAAAVDWYDQDFIDQRVQELIDTMKEKLAGRAAKTAAEFPSR